MRLFSPATPLIRLAFSVFSLLLAVLAAPVSAVEVSVSQNTSSTISGNSPITIVEPLVPITASALYKCNIEFRHVRTMIPASALPRRLRKPIPYSLPSRGSRFSAFRLFILIHERQQFGAARNNGNSELDGLDKLIRLRQQSIDDHKRPAGIRDAADFR